MSELNTCTSSTRPATPAAGDILYETDTYQTIIYDGAEWREFPSTTSPYDLDGTNSVSTRPLWHFDAAKINGVDAADNPSDGGSLTTAWKSLPNGRGERFNLQAQSDSSLQPTWYESGENSLPYVDWDGGDRLVFEKENQSIRGPFLWFQVMKSDSGYWTGMNGSSYGLFTRRGDLLYYYSSAGNGYNGVQSSNLDSLSASTRMLLFEKPDTTSASWLYVDGNDGQGSGSGASTSTIAFSGFGTGFSTYAPDGKVYEMALWVGDGIDDTAGPLTAADKNELIDYVTNKYGLSSFIDF